ncbi:hypothetical protein Bca52824_065956 [Brassica carinata]|uniref:Uncharacterized protein n=1 Tax=Brassica carinata TaxID=52824 RepID=A0A8X7UCW8_BRACI|nr:hypothetical protein Bca52824_065956 [Brassica carinata]
MIYTIQTGMRFSVSTFPSSTPEETGRDRRTLRLAELDTQSLRETTYFPCFYIMSEVFLKPSRSPPTQPNFQPLEKSSFYPHYQHAEEINRNTRSPPL